MNALIAFILSTLFLACRCDFRWSPDNVCQIAKGLQKQNAVSVRSVTGESGEWVTTFSAYEVRNHYHESPPIVEIQRTVTECGDKDVVYIKAIVTVSKNSARPPSVLPLTEKLRLYEKGGRNAVVSANGKTVTRINDINDSGHAGVLTNRTLNDDELFEVRLEKTTTKHEDTVGIGVTYNTPTSMDYQSWTRCGTIMLFDQRIYEHGDVVTQYGTNLKTLKIGDRAGVMKKKNGDLHFFINGKDQGIAKSNITYAVYGVVDVYGSAVQISIVD